MHSTATLHASDGFDAARCRHNKAHGPAHRKVVNPSPSSSGESRRLSHRSSTIMASITLSLGPGGYCGTPPCSRTRSMEAGSAKGGLDPTVCDGKTRLKWLCDAEALYHK
eukprot:7390843-Prymnesium_polylepis.2